jgi:hypothetical protein
MFGYGVAACEAAPRGLGVTGVEQRLFRLLRDGVFQRLEEIAGKARAARGPLSGEVTVLVGAWRTVLEMHEHSRWGRCPWCRRRRTRAGVCTVWLVAIGYFLGAPPRE